MGRLKELRESLVRAYRLAQARRAERIAQGEQVDTPRAAPSGGARRRIANADAAPDGDAESAHSGTAGGVVEPDGSESGDARAVVVPQASVNSQDDEEVPHGLRLAAAWAWRLLLLVAAGAVCLWLVGRLRTVLIPLSISLLLSALLAPAVGFLRRRVRMPRSLATAVVLIGGLAIVVGTLTLVINQFIEGVPDLSAKAVKGLNKIRDSLQEGPTHLSNQQLEDALDTAGNWVQDNSDKLTDSAVSTATAALEFFASAFLVLFATFFFLRDGRRIWTFVVRLFPRGARESLSSAGEAAWLTLVAYVRATVLVAFIDAVGIGLVLFGFKVQLALPLAALVFLAAFIPIVGATISGAVAVLVALVDKGVIVALIILGSVIAVQQIEGHVLQPLIMGRAVAIHPLAVIVAIATGVMLAGIIGALVAVPIVAVLNTGVRHIVDRRKGEPPPDAVVVASSSPT